MAGTGAVPEMNKKSELLPVWWVMRNKLPRYGDSGGHKRNPFGCDKEQGTWDFPPLPGSRNMHHLKVWREN